MVVTGARCGSRNMSLVYRACYYSTRTVPSVEIPNCVFSWVKTKQTVFFFLMFPGKVHLVLCFFVLL